MRKHLLFCAALAAAPLAADAQTYRCVGKDGKKYYGQTIPTACLGQPIEQLSKQGTLMRRIDPEGDEKMRAAKQAEALKKKEDDALAREERRRNRALLATYTSQKDIEDARRRALEDNAKTVRDVQQRIETIKKRQAGYSKEMQFYGDAKGRKAGGESSGGAKPPPKLIEDIRAADTDLKVQYQMLEQRKKEAESINARYDEDKKRFMSLTQRR